MPITATTSLSRRIDLAEGALVLGMAGASRAGGSEVDTWCPGGAVAVLGEPGSPFNKVIGLGYGPAPSDEEWHAIEQRHRSRGARVQVELSTLADPAAGLGLTGRGYRLAGFENVLACRLEQVTVDAGAGALAVTRVGPPDSLAWIETVLEGFLNPDAFDGPPSHESFDRATLRHTYEVFATVPGVERLLAWIDDRPAGGASLFLHEGIAVLCGAATLPAFRRRGVQSALLHARLALARQAGCELATVTTQPGSKSQENVQRAGFELVYSRAVLVREPQP